MDAAYCLSKLSNDDAKLLPGWTGYNTLLNSSSIPSMTKQGYLPVTDESPTKIDTVYTILKQSLDIAECLELKHMTLVMDQAIYSKAQQIRWQDNIFKSRLVVRLGEFHTLMAFMGTIGKCFQASGFEDILIKSGVVAPGSIGGIISGHHYNRSVRVHKLMFEALQRLRWKSYLDACSEQESSGMLEIARAITKAGPSEKIFDIIQQESYKDVIRKYKTLIEKQRSVSPTFEFW